MKEINVLSLCDGMSGGQIALERAGIKVGRYYASEIKQIGIKVCKENYPNTIHIGERQNQRHLYMKITNQCLKQLRKA